MRLLTYRAHGGQDRLGVVRADGVADVAELLGDGPWTMARVLDDGAATLARIQAAVEAGLSGAVVPVASLELRAPVSPRKIVAVGRNYREHAAEEAAATPEEPLLFAKLPSALAGDGASISWSAALTGQVDYEAELAVVIGRTARNVPVELALEHVFGYTCLNDVSARDLQVRDGQWMRAKSLDTFCPMGPWIVTADEIPDPAVLRVRCRVNGEVRQDETSAALVHGVAELVAYSSRSFTLEPGDIIATGTPGGVGAFRDPPVFLQDGDLVEVEIDAIGTLSNRCRVVP